MGKNYSIKNKINSILNRRHYNKEIEYIMAYNVGWALLFNKIRFIRISINKGINY